MPDNELEIKVVGDFSQFDAGIEAREGRKHVATFAAEGGGGGRSPLALPYQPLGPSYAQTSLGSSAALIAGSAGGGVNLSAVQNAADGLARVLERLTTRIGGGFNQEQFAYNRTQAATRARMGTILDDVVEGERQATLPVAPGRVGGGADLVRQTRAGIDWEAFGQYASARIRGRQSLPENPGAMVRYTRTGTVTDHDVIEGDLFEGTWTAAGGSGGGGGGAYVGGGGPGGPGATPGGPGRRMWVPTGNRGAGGGGGSNAFNYRGGNGFFGAPNMGRLLLQGLFAGVEINRTLNNLNRTQEEENVAPNQIAALQAELAGVEQSRVGLYGSAASLILDSQGVGPEQASRGLRTAINLLQTQEQTRYAQRDAGFVSQAAGISAVGSENAARRRLVEIEATRRKTVDPWESDMRHQRTALTTSHSEITSRDASGGWSDVGYFLTGGLYNPQENVTTSVPNLNASERQIARGRIATGTAAIGAANQAAATQAQDIQDQIRLGLITAQAEGGIVANNASLTLTTAINSAAAVGTVGQGLVAGLKGQRTAAANIAAETARTITSNALIQQGQLLAANGGTMTPTLMAQMATIGATAAASVSASNIAAGAAYASSTYQIGQAELGQNQAFGALTAGFTQQSVGIAAAGSRNPWQMIMADNDRRMTAAIAQVRSVHESFFGKTYGPFQEDAAAAAPVNEQTALERRNLGEQYDIAQGGANFSLRAAQAQFSERNPIGAAALRSAGGFITGARESLQKDRSRENLSIQHTRADAEQLELQSLRQDYRDSFTAQLVDLRTTTVTNRKDQTDPGKILASIDEALRDLAQFVRDQL